MTVIRVSSISLELCWCVKDFTALRRRGVESGPHRQRPVLVALLLHLGDHLKF